MEWPGDFPEDHASVELLVPSVSSDLDFEQFMKDTEEKLNLNANSIEQQLKELQAKIGDHRMAERPPSPTECLHWFSIKTQNSIKPVTSGHQELIDFFNALQQYLRSEDEVKEEVTLQLLINLSAQCGVCFPCTHLSPSSPSTHHPHLIDASLVHTVTEDTSLEIQEAWDDICLQLRRYLVSRLSSRNPENSCPGQISTLSILERVHSLQQLFFLYPESEVLNYYQGIKRQYVLDILHSSMCSSPSCETGFDRLAMSFSCATSVLTQNLVEELHVLSRLAEPHTILGFINAAYLSTLAEELASLMEKECKTAQRDNTVMGSKNKKYSVKSRASVAPMEPPVKNRSFSLTSHQLKALTQLACTLLRFEGDVKELVTNIIFINCAGDTPGVKVSLSYNPALLSIMEEEIAVSTVGDHMAKCRRFWRDTRAALLHSTEENAKWANQTRTPAPIYSVGQRVWLSTRNFPLKTECKKLASRFVGPFVINAIVNPASIWLVLPPSLRVNPTFHVSQVKPVFVSSLCPPSKPPLPPKRVDGGLVYAVHRIVDAHCQSHGIQFLVDWKGYEPEERSCLASLSTTIPWKHPSSTFLPGSLLPLSGDPSTAPIRSSLQKCILKKYRENPDMPTESKRSTTETPPLTSEAQVLEFNWRSAFRGLVPHMEHCVKVVIDDVCAKNLRQEEALHSSGHSSISLIPIAGHMDITATNAHLNEDSLYIYVERETPKMTAKFSAAIMTELDALLPLAAACKDNFLLEVRSSFVEACSRAAFAILGRLQERALEVPSSAPLKNLPALLATCIYVQQRLERYTARLRDSNTFATKISLTPIPIQKFHDTVVAIRDQLNSYCIQVCSTSILQDAESHHWTDPKPFYEGERCSFSVQMWFYFLCGLRSDLWEVLPADLARDVLGQVLCETFQLLVQRYARARASYKRHLQIRCDITAVLLYVEHLMWSICETPEALVHCNPCSAITIIANGSDWPYQIHSLCEQLLTVLIIATAPITLVHRTFVINAATESIPHQTVSTIVHWLNAINPDLFSEQVMRDGLVGEAALTGQLRLLTSDPGYNPKLLLRMLLYRDCHLPRILLENSHFCQEMSTEVSSENFKTGNDFIVALFNLLSCLSNVPKALTQAFQPYLDWMHIWEHLFTLADTTRTAPVVISCIREIVTKPTDNMLVHLVSMVLGWQVAEEPNGALFKRTVPESVLAKIPKDWNYTLLNGKGKDTITKTVISLAIQALSFIFTNLPLAVASLPLPIRFLFQVAEKHLSQHARQLRIVGLLLWVLLGCLIQGLEDPDSLEQISGLALDRGAKDCLSLLAECVQAAMGIPQKGIPKPTVHKVLQALEEKRPKWINVQLQKARKLCSESIFEEARERRAAMAELTEQKIGLMLLEVCHKAGGSNYLRQIYHIIQGNEELLMSKLRGGTDLPNHVSHLVKFDLGSHGDRACFNPLHQFDHIGKKKLDQSVLVDWAWDWLRLLPAYRGMSQVTFKSLLANRWEIQEGAELEDGEKAVVEELKKAFFVCCCSPGPQEPRETDETPAERAQGETQSDNKSVAQ
ncbi:uncharacterized protein KIAA0825 homolog [Pholidichthys leucotaenia]